MDYKPYKASCLTSIVAETLLLFQRMVKPMQAVCMGWLFCL